MELKFSKSSLTVKYKLYLMVEYIDNYGDSIEIRLTRLKNITALNYNDNLSYLDSVINKYLRLKKYLNNPGSHCSPDSDTINLLKHVPKYYSELEETISTCKINTVQVVYYDALGDLRSAIPEINN